MKSVRRRLAALLLLSSCATAALGAPADDIKALLEKGQAAEAYELGQKHAEQLGNPFFDFYFGIAAIGAGRAGEGVLALERFVVNAPDNINGRLELGRGYFVLGEDTRARQEFEIVMASNPPPEVQANVQRFLDAIRSREFLYRPTAGFYVEAGLGYDTNVNGGVSADSITRWGLVFALPSTGVRQSDDFATFGAGFNWSHPLRPGMYVSASGGFDGKYHDTQTAFDQQALRAEGGLTWIREQDLWRLSAAFSTLEVDNNRFRDVWSLSGEWHRQIDEMRSYSVFGQYADLSYTGGNSLRDSGLTTVGVGYRQAMVSPLQPLLSANVYVGREDVRNSIRADLSRDLYGLRVSGSITPAPKWSLIAGISYQSSRYDGGAPPPLPGLPAEPTRKDDYTAVDAGLSYAFDRNWSVKGELLLSRNGSNDSLSGFKRDVLGVKVRYTFR